MVSELIKNNIKEQYKEFKINLASEDGEYCIRCSRKDDNSPFHRVIHKVTAALVLAIIGSFLFYLISLQ